nr:hypothetical protein [Actinomycetota bacterium]
MVEGAALAAPTVCADLILRGAPVTGTHTRCDAVAACEPALAVVGAITERHSADHQLARRDHR